MASTYDGDVVYGDLEEIYDAAYDVLVEKLRAALAAAAASARIPPAEELRTMRLALGLMDTLARQGSLDGTATDIANLRRQLTHSVDLLLAAASV